MSQRVLHDEFVVLPWHIFVVLVNQLISNYFIRSQCITLPQLKTAGQNRNCPPPPLLMQIVLYIL